MIICDTREQKWSHIEDWFKVNTVPYRIQKLDYGDYMNEHNPHLAIDRKASLDELATNLCSPDSSRFWREIRGATRLGIHMIVLIEDRRYQKPNDVISWRSKWSRITGAKLFEKMFAISNAYGVEFVFCDRHYTGRVIKEVLDDG